MTSLLASRTAYQQATNVCAAIERDLQDSTKEEQRLRENLTAVRNAEAAVQQFLKKLIVEEEKIEKLRTHLAQARADESAKLKDWEKLAGSLEIE